jgi:hypothetical protein
MNMSEWLPIETAPDDGAEVLLRVEWPDEVSVSMAAMMEHHSGKRY